jgi:hypothetical protein
VVGSIAPAAGRQLVAKRDPEAAQTFQDSAAFGIGGALDGAFAFGGLGPGIHV